MITALQRSTAITDLAGQQNGALSFPNPVKAGSTIVVCMATGGTGTPSTSVTDNQGNTYTRIDTSRSDGSAQVEMYYAKNVLSNGGTFTVTMNFTSAVVGNDAYLIELDGVDPVNPLSNGTGTTGTSATPTAPTITPIVHNCYVLAIQVDDNADGTSITAGAGFQLLASQLIISTRNRLGVEAKIQSNANIAASFTIGASNPWGIIVAAFRPLRYDFNNHGLRPHPFSPGLAR